MGDSRWSPDYNWGLFNLHESVYYKIMLFAVYPGTVKTHEGETLTLSYSQLIQLYGVRPEDCVLGSTVPQRRLMFYILLKPRADNVYPNMPLMTDLGSREKWGPDFDGKKKWTMETDYDALYSEQNSEEKL